MSKYERKAQSQRKHGPLSISGASKAPVAPPVQRPGWKGPGYVKKQPSRQVSSPQTPASSIQTQYLPMELQQFVLDIFRDTFPGSRDFEALKPTLQEINDAVVARDFERAFGGEGNREAYVIRWAPSRALAYANAVAGLCKEFPDEAWVTRFAEQSKNGNLTAAAKVVAFGGGAADLMALTAAVRHLHPYAAGASEETSTTTMDTRPQETNDSGLLDLHLVDAFDWSAVISSLELGSKIPPVLSKYASAAARASNAALLSSAALRVTFTQAEIFDMSRERLREVLGTKSCLVTLMMTLDELYKTSIPKNTLFLRRLTAEAAKDSLLLAIDTPGASYQVPTNSNDSDGDARTYTMQWLMDRVLLEQPKNVEGQPGQASWKKLVNDGNRHHRLHEKLKYPASLENLKLQVHIYKRT